MAASQAGGGGGSGGSIHIQAGTTIAGVGRISANGGAAIGGGAGGGSG